ncbi:MAG: hypothetical protein HQL22_11045 [Candidatus Omnitrophica bacterium]|nr:hypothetical protein [Candidatus Omnitrophota bacterium]
MRLILVFLVIVSALACFCGTISADRASIFVVGQDVESIKDYYSSFGDYSARGKVRFPDGIMAYTAINDVRGLADPVDQGAGVNCVDHLLREYPGIKVVQIGLYIKFMLKEIVSGELDGNIDKIGEWIKGSGKHVYLRIGYEFDNPENEYDPQQYVAAYRYIVDRLHKTNVTNVDFVWHTMAWQDRDQPVYDPLKWYPGDHYVDWLGISFFDAERHEERDIAAELARKIHKPLMIAESSPFSQNTVEQKLAWMKSLFEFINKNDVKFLSYINVDWDRLPLFENKKWGDARLQNSPVLMQEWLRHIGSYSR